MCDCFLMICLLWILLCGLHCKVFVLWLVVCLGMFHVKRSWMVELFGVCCLLPVSCQGVGVSRGTSLYGWLWWWLVGRLGGVLWWFFSVWISFVCSPTEGTGILEITISFMVTYRCFTWNVCGDVRGAEEWGDGFWSRHFSPTGCCGGWSF